MCNIMLQAPTLGRKCDILLLFHCGVDGHMDGWVNVWLRVTSKIFWMDR